MSTSEISDSTSIRKLATYYLLLSITIIISGLTIFVASTYLGYILFMSKNEEVVYQFLYYFIRVTYTVNIITNVIYLILFYLMLNKAHVFKETASLYSISLMVLLAVSLSHIIISSYVLSVLTYSMIRESITAGVALDIVSPIVSYIVNGAFTLGVALMGYALYKASVEYTEFSSIKLSGIIMMVGGVLSFINYLNLLGEILILVSYLLAYSNLKKVSTTQHSSGIGIYESSYK